MLPNAAAFLKRENVFQNSLVNVVLGLTGWCQCSVCVTAVYKPSCWVKTTWKLPFPSIWCCHGFIFFAVPNYARCFVYHLEISSVQCSLKGKLDVLVLWMATVCFRLSHLPCAVLWKLQSLHLEPLYTEVEPPSYFPRNLMILEGSCKTCVLLPTTCCFKL